uniref:Uncharacterized protein n=1 Tax=Aplanochytrium stocchinoi TaxID=215587 RepID=A0A7S3LQN3_9STRA|eukprot:CAMPEP_0204864306 /NCGR_PEP_ID=MMETSP1348-20121228/3968_1 /ASSEMBLY_ACC=CAM_ASM_000700 /TAXON_ID=215587 /ORGANISM="Aplanochytrium stocchinoi, Strain GSBS06" /LENGTH=421 /DNA_ID=CAMNT_0052014899 /DNA_START=225 /DNA_END=1490 /DNA_ORIENTATION=+
MFGSRSKNSSRAGRNGGSSYGGRAGQNNGGAFSRGVPPPPPSRGQKGGNRRQPKGNQRLGKAGPPKKGGRMSKERMTTKSPKYHIDIPPPPPPGTDEPPPPPIDEHPDVIEMEQARALAKLQQKQQQMRQQWEGPSQSKRNTPRKSKYDFSHEEHIYEQIDQHKVDKDKRRKSMRPNRYAGLARPSRVSVTSGAYDDEEELWGRYSLGTVGNHESVVSGEGAGTRSARKQKPKAKPRAKAKQNKPSSNRVPAKDFSGPQDPDHTGYVDYTVVPLLLRSGIDYEKANMFGDILKMKYSTRNVKNMMQSFFALFEALERHSIAISQQIRLHVMEDAYWNSIGEEDEEGGKRASYIYYRESPDNSSIPKKSTPRKQRTSFRERRASAMSQRTEYDQTFIDDGQEDVKMDDETFRKSMRLLFQNM